LIDRVAVVVKDPMKRDRGADTLLRQQQVQSAVADSLLQTSLCSDATVQTIDIILREGQTAVRGKRRAVNAGAALYSKHLAIAVNRGATGAEQAGGDQAEAVKACNLVISQDGSTGDVKAGGSQTEAVKAISLAAGRDRATEETQLQPAAVIESLCHQSSEVGDPCDPETSVSEPSREAAVSIVADGPISGEAQLHESTALGHHDKAGSNTNSRRAADEAQVGDANQTLQGAPYTGSCGSAMCPAVSVPKCHDERVSSGADDPISGEVCLDCAFVQACNTTQEHEARSEQVGGASVSSRDQVEGCSDLLSTVGKELSSETNDSPKASDRAAIQIPCCHGVQRKADGIRVSHVSIVADGPFSGEPEELEALDEAVMNVQPTAAVNGALAIAAREWQGITELAAVYNTDRVTWPIEDQQGKETLLRCARRAMNLQLVNESHRMVAPCLDRSNTK
jgi:hypothetical protein